MNLPLSTWLCGGALLASLAFNARSLQADPPPATLCPLMGSESGCAIDLAALSVSEAQARELAELGAVGREAEDLARRADERQAVLERLLADPTCAPESARALAREVGELRARAATACVEAILSVRRVLTPEQTAQLLESCARRCKSDG